jgi:hypothetical protein
MQEIAPALSLGANTVLRCVLAPTISFIAIQNAPQHYRNEEYRLL